VDIHRVSFRCLENRLAVPNICLPSSFVIPLKAGIHVLISQLYHLGFWISASAAMFHALSIANRERDLISSFVSDIFVMANDFISPFQLSVPP
jgi:hypothetical protein